MPESTSPTFHPFPRLPLELRQQIWELSIEPREVVIAARRTMPGHGRQPTPSPPLLVACAESRSHCQRFYTKATVDAAGFNPSPAPAFYWVNFALDEVYMHDCDFLYFSGTSLVRRLALVADDRDYFLNRMHYMGAI